jgi:multidrug efflux pump subunit AcrB
MILLFLGSWRSTVIIAVSIPLSILGAIALLAAFGETLNIMTLGGLALAVGILVDDATVTIENINWHLEQGKDVETAIMDGAAQIVTPAFVSCCICIVFVPMFFRRRRALPVRADGRSGDVRDGVFVHPLAHAGADDGEVHAAPACGAHRFAWHERELPPSKNPLVRFQRGFEARFERFRDGYRDTLALALGHRKAFVAGFLAFVVASFALLPFLGRNFFPRSTAARSSCTCARRSARAWRKRRTCSHASSKPCAGSSRPRNSGPSPTTWACRFPAST